MCLMVYVAAEKPLSLITWNEAAPEFRARP